MESQGIKKFVILNVVGKLIIGQNENQLKRGGVIVLLMLRNGGQPLHT